MIEITNPQGRLVSIRAVTPVTQEDTDDLVIQSARLFRPNEPRRVVAVDARKLRVLTPAYADRLALLMRNDNPFTLRTAFLLPAKGDILDLQFSRLFLESDSQTRRTFRFPIELEQWLGQVLNAEEKQALSVFLHEEGSTLPPHEQTQGMMLDY